jgi:hypothetical protein
MSLVLMLDHAADRSNMSSGAATPSRVRSAFVRKAIMMYGYEWDTTTWLTYAILDPADHPDRADRDA